jgi:hypothetical protein
MAFKPFLIADMKHGKDLKMDPWLLPQDGFETLLNCHLKDGVLEKRRGFEEFAQMVAVDTTTKAPTMQTNPVTGILNHQDNATENLLVADKNRINKYLTGASVNNAVTAIADAGGGDIVVTAAGNAYSVDDIITHVGFADSNYNGTFRVKTIDSPTADDYTVTATFGATGTGTSSQERFLDLTKNKIRYIGKTGQNWTPTGTIKGATSGATGVVSALILDTGTVAGADARGTIIFTQGGVTGTFQDNEELQENGTPANIAGQSDGANSDDAFTGDNTNYFQAASWNLLGTSRTYITNNNDPIQKYDGTNLSRLTVDIGDANDKNNLTSCRLIFVYRERLVLLSTIEDGVDYKQRARYCTVKDPQSWPTDNFKDIPTQDVIVSADFLFNDLYVWCEKSTWRLAYTGDAASPFEWEFISGTEGCVAQNSLVTQEERQIALGTTRLNISDSRTVRAADSKLPEFTLDWILNSRLYTQGVVMKEERLILEAYAASGASANADGNTYPDSALVLNYENGSFSRYKFANTIHTLGKSAVESDLTWAQDTTWADYDAAWNARTAESGYPTTLFGSDNGKIYQLNTTGADDGNNIEFEAIGAQMNPYIKQGRQARLEKIKFLCDVDANATFDVLSYVNTDTTAIQTETVTCSAVEGSDSLVWYTVFVNAVADFHRIEITNNASSNRPRIHAIMPYFEPAGLLEAA